MDSVHVAQLNQNLQNKRNSENNLNDQEMPSIRIDNLKKIQKFGVSGEVMIEGFEEDPDLLPSPIQSSEKSSRNNQIATNGDERTASFMQDSSKFVGNSILIQNEQS